jgi:hypothetical protein
MMTTVYFMGVLAGDRDRARSHHGQRRVVRRRAFSTSRNFLATCIRHRPRFRILALHQRALMCGVIVAPLGGALVPSIGEPAERGLLALTARLAAVALTSVVGSADHEHAGAVTAGQREDIELVHPTRMVENWTAISETTTVSYVLARPSIAGTSRAQVWRPGPSLFPPATKYREVTCGNATSRPGPRVSGDNVRQRHFSPWSPGPR